MVSASPGEGPVCDRCIAPSGNVQTSESSGPKTDADLESQLLHSIDRFQRRHMNSAWTLMSKSKFFALSAIRRMEQDERSPEGVPVSTIAARMHASMPATSRTLGGLEKAGLIERRPDERDRRNTLVTLTAEGERAHAETHGKLMEYMSLVVDDLGRDRAQRLAADLDDATASMQRAIDVMRERYPEYGEVAPPPHPAFGCKNHGHGHLQERGGE